MLSNNSAKLKQTTTATAHTKEKKRINQSSPEKQTINADQRTKRHPDPQHWNGLDSIARNKLRVASFMNDNEQSVIMDSNDACVDSSDFYTSSVMWKNMHMFDRTPEAG